MVIALVLLNGKPPGSRPFRLHRSWPVATGPLHLIWSRANVRYRTFKEASSQQAQGHPAAVARGHRDCRRSAGATGHRFLRGHRWLHLAQARQGGHLHNRRRIERRQRRRQARHQHGGALPGDDEGRRGRGHRDLRPRKIGGGPHRAHRNRRPSFSTALSIDTNSPWLMGKLEELWLPVWRKTLVRDDRAALVARPARGRAGRSEIVIGGKTAVSGPRPTISPPRCSPRRALAVKPAPRCCWSPTLPSRPGCWPRGLMTVSANNRRQAMVPEGSVVIANRHGTAPMFELRMEKARFFFLPGVPREYRALSTEELLPRLSELAIAAPSASGRVASAVAYGLPGIATCDEKLASLPQRYPQPLAGLHPDARRKTTPSLPSLAPGLRAILKDATAWRGARASRARLFCRGRTDILAGDRSGPGCQGRQGGPGRDR